MVKLNPLIRKLEFGADLTDQDRAVLSNLTHQSYPLGARQDIIREGDRPDAVHLVMGGMACRYKMLPDGGRQIIALLLPGDFCDLHVAILDAMDHSIATLSPCTLVDIPRSTIINLIENHPRITRALWWCTLVDEATLREWLVNLGRRDAERRMAHLFCELLVRLRAVGLTEDNSYELPITQIELGELLGISTVHTNRSLQRLREADLIAFTSRRVTIHGMQQLSTYCGFNPNYLHATRRPVLDM